MSDLTPPQPQQPTPPAGATPAPAPYPGDPQKWPYPAPGAYQPPVYPTQQYPGAAPVYGAPQGYRPVQPTNTLAIVSLIASIIGFIWVLPFIGSLTGAIMGQIALGQIARTGERGRGLALAGTIIGWIGVGIFAIIAIFIVIAIVASSSYRG